MTAFIEAVGVPGRIIYRARDLATGLQVEHNCPAYSDPSPEFPAIRDRLLGRLDRLLAEIAEIRNKPKPPAGPHPS